MDPYDLLPPTEVIEMKDEEVEAADRCPNFKYVCMTVLEIGNYLNTGTRNKNAVGYKMETLLKTGDTKSPFRKGLTLLFYIALHCMKTKPSCLDLPKEYEPVGEAFSYPFDMLTGDVAKIVKDIDGMLKYAEEAKQCKDPADKWEDQISGFAKKMEMNKAMLDGLITRLEQHIDFFPASNILCHHRVVAALSNYSLDLKPTVAMLLQARGDVQETVYPVRRSAVRKSYGRYLQEALNLCRHVCRRCAVSGG